MKSLISVSLLAVGAMLMIIAANIISCSSARAELPGQPPGVAGTPQLWEFHMFAYAVGDGSAPPNFANGPVALVPTATRIQMYANEGTCNQYRDLMRTTMVSTTLHIGTGSTNAEIGFYFSPCIRVQ